MTKPILHGYLSSYVHENRGANISYEHAGWLPGGDTELEGLVWPHPLTNPKAVSSTASLKAGPQLGSLEGGLASVSGYGEEITGQNSPGSARGAVEIRADVVGKAVLSARVGEMIRGVVHDIIHVGWGWQRTIRFLLLCLSSRHHSGHCTSTWMGTC